MTAILAGSPSPPVTRRSRATGSTPRSARRRTPSIEFSLSGSQLPSSREPVVALAGLAAGKTDSQSTPDAHGTSAAGSFSGAGQPAKNPTISLADPALNMAAGILDDLEKVKIANANRLRQLTRSTEDADGELRGFGLTEDHSSVRVLAGIVNGLAALEKEATKNLERAMRRHPLYAWVLSLRGVGPKQAARLLASIRDPYIRPEYTRADETVVPAGPRTVGALWAYCGYDPHEGVARKRKRGEKANWSTVAKTRAHRIAESCLKQRDKTCIGADDSTTHLDGCCCSPFRVKYDERRAHTAKTHPEWTAGHSHNDAMRVTAKEILKDLWRAAREIHGVPEE